jgi:hypothetical protein
VRNLLVGLFWLWLLVSLGIYAVRVWRRMTRGPKADPKDESPTAGVDPGIPIVSPPPGLGARPTSTLPPPKPAPKPASPDPGPRTSDPPMETGAGARSGLFAPTSSPAATSAAAASQPVAEARQTVAELVAGIAMPCDLVPIVGSDRFLDPYHVAFSTDTAPAATVGGGVADELERLGFALQSTAENRLAATKNDRQLTVTIYPDAADVAFGDGKAYPTVPPGSVVVEFTS